MANLINSYRQQTGLTINDPGESAMSLKNNFGYNSDGVYYIVINNISTPVYCIMNSALDGGGWMMALKATRGNTFNYDSSYWTTANTLNTTQTNRNDGDAKFDTFNYFEGKDFLALFPDIGQGGSLSVSGYPWTWLQNNYNDGNVKTPLSFFQTTGSNMNYGGSGKFIRDAKTFSGWASGVFSSQVDVRFYGFNYIPYTQYSSTFKVRWGFGWNENSEGLYPGVVGGAPGSNDVTGGIGMGAAAAPYSAGDYIACCQDTTGINRSARVEMYVR